MTGVAAVLAILRDVSLPSLRAHRMRTVLTLLGIVLATQMVVAIRLISRSVVESFQQTAATIAGTVDYQLSNVSAGVPEDLVYTIAAVPGVASASGLANRMDHLPAELSGGEMQRVAIARALVIEPALVLADEPTGNLDSVTSDEILCLLRDYARERGATVVLVTHSAAAAEYGERIVTLRDGAVVAVETRAAEGVSGRPSSSSS